MPELPEVETSCAGIRPHCLNQKISHLIVRQPKLRWPVDPLLPALVKNHTIKSVSRRGKYILLEVADGEIMIHLGMSGSLRVLLKDVAVTKHDHIDIVLGNGKIIRYNDPRRFGSFIYNLEGARHKLLSKLGPEPLSDDFNTDYLYRIARSRKVAVKTLIMNSHVVVGVGNIYAQEALFRAGIKPQRAANKVTKVNVERLTDSIKHILQEAIKAGGSSLKDFTAADGKPGYFQHAHQVYARNGEACNQCGTALKQLLIGQRTSVHCTQCQS